MIAFIVRIIHLMGIGILVSAWLLGVPLWLLSMQA